MRWVVFFFSLQALPQSLGPAIGQKLLSAYTLEINRAILVNFGDFGSEIEYKTRLRGAHPVTDWQHGYLAIFLIIHKQ